MKDNAKKFSPAGLTHSASHHLMAVSDLLDERGYARVSDIARRLNLTRGSVSVAMRSLKQSGHVLQDARRFYQLTDLGRTAVGGLRARHEVVERFLTEVLGLSPQQSHRESCLVENLIKGPTARRLIKLLRFWRERALDAAFQGEADSACPRCEIDDPDQCPCCALECLDGECSKTGATAGQMP